MTDAEKELRLRAKEAEGDCGIAALVGFQDAANPSAVLALLDRIEALEGLHKSGQRTLALVMKSRDEAEAELQAQRKRIEALEKNVADAELRGAKAERDRNARIVEKVGFKHLALVIRAPRFGEEA